MARNCGVGSSAGDQADQSVHFSYEMVALSPRCCAELGIPLSEEDRKRPYVEVSGRKGLGVKADDLIDTLITKALEEVASRHPEASPDEQKQVAADIAIGQLDGQRPGVRVHPSHLYRRCRAPLRGPLALDCARFVSFNHD